MNSDVPRVFWGTSATVMYRMRICGAGFGTFMEPAPKGQRPVMPFYALQGPAASVQGCATEGSKSRR